ncbi:MAG: response regulator transcription factor [Acidobacteriota bacterium]
MKPIRLLLADDHALFRQSLCTVLAAEADLEVVGEASAEREVLAQVAALEPDVLLLDVALGPGDGLKVAAALRQGRFRPRVLMVSMHDQERVVEQALAAGADGYALKEDSIEDLVYAIRSVHRGGRYVSPTLLRAWKSDAARDRPRLRGESRRRELTERQREILLLAAEGKTNREIAGELGIRQKTVENHRANIAQQYGLTRAVDYVRYAIRKGWMEA